MTSSASTTRLTCRLSAVNGSVDALVFDVEMTLELSGAPRDARAFAAELAAYRARPDATYRGILDIVANYVDLVAS